MKTKAGILLISAGLIMFFVSCGKKSTEPQAKERLWTIMGYFDGNNNLDVSQAGTSYIIADVQEMEKVGSTDQVTAVVMVSSLKTGGNANYYLVEKKPDELPDKISSKSLKDLGTKDMSDPQTLKDFMNWAKTEYPAKHYALIINDHGGGWRGACEDEQNGGGSLMSMPAIRQALSNTVHFDVIVFHACLMSQVEVAYELQEVGDYMVACEFTMPMLSVLGSDVWMAQLVANPNMESLDLATKIAQAVYDKGNEAQKITHMAVTDLSKIRSLGAKISELGNRLITENRGAWNEVQHAWGQTHYTDYDDPAFVDLREFLKKILQEPTLKEINLIRNSANDVISAINAAVPFTKTNAPGLSRGGLTIHFPFIPDQFDSTNYVKLKFKETNWYNFLSVFIKSIGYTEVSGFVRWPGRNLSQYCYALLDSSHTDQIILLAQARVNPADGSFTIPLSLQKATEVWVEGWDDVNNNGRIDAGDGFGWWDINGDGRWNEMIRLKPGDRVTNAEVRLALQNLQLAKVNRR
ncbi:MAG: clostripain-related cysteine peptidase [candidate division KSB1 bacterium]|nr:clostripain-related cysteine peptidase [candidate division KSB1 bacterium]